MSEEAFRAKRRQKFLTEKYFKLNVADLKNSLANFEVARADELARQSFVDPSTESSSFKWSLKLLRLNYTAGEPIEAIRPIYAAAMRWFRDWHQAEENYSKELARKHNEALRLTDSPLELDNLEYFQLRLLASEFVSVNPKQYAKLPLGCKARAVVTCCLNICLKRS